MKNISISNESWKQLRYYRNKFEFKHYSKVINHLIEFYENHTSLLEEQIHENLIEKIHIEDNRLVVDEIKNESYLILSEDQKCIKKYLIKKGIRYRIWNIDKLGNIELVYDSDRGKKQSSLEIKNDEKKKINNNDKMWDI